MKRLLQASVALLTLLASPVMAADMAVRPPAPPPVAPVVPVYSWTGFYFGANAGWIRSDDSISNQAIPAPDAVLGFFPPAGGITEGLAALSTGGISVGNKSGFIGGGQAGYNYQFDNWVAGIETDFQGISGLSSSGSITTPSGGALVNGLPITSNLTGTADTRWLGTVRGRLGFVPTPTVLVYGTGGLAYGDVTASASLSQSGSSGAAAGLIGAGTGTFSQTRAGWTAGGGVEWMFAQNWSAKLEYLHYDLGTGSFNWAASVVAFPAAPPGVVGAVYQSEVTSVHFLGNIVRAGLNYKF